MAVQHDTFDAEVQSADRSRVRSDRADRKEVRSGQIRRLHVALDPVAVQQGAATCAGR